MQDKSWVTYLDIYGFSAQVTVGEAEHLSQALSRIVDQATRFLEVDQIHHYFLSDSVILVCPDFGYKSFNKILTATKLIQKFAIAEGLVFRGCVAYGTMRVTKSICVGEPLIRAYLIEQSLACPLVIMPEREFALSGYNPAPVFSLIPAKDGGEISASAVFPAPLGELFDLCAKMLQQARRDGPTHIVRPWRMLLELVEAQQRSGANE